MSEDPSTIDGEIIEEMKSLELMISFHEKALMKGLVPRIFRPEEIKGLLEINYVQGLWDTEDYSAIRLAYASAWVRYYTVRFNDEVFYTEQQFADFFKTD